jgi:arylsulfatase A-like enzyme
VSPSARGDKTKRKLIPITNTEDVRTDFVTLGEALKQQGYVCGHIGKWHLGSDLDGSKTGPLSQGFDYNIAGDRAGSPYSYFYPYCRKQKCHLGLDEGSEGEYLTDRLTSEAIKFVEQTKDKPFFLYMAHHAVHTPLKAPQTLVDKYQKKTKGKYQTNAIYAAMVENLDWNVGRLCHAIDSLGLSENTLIVFYSDNGGAAAATNNFRLRGAKGMPYEGGIRVPLIMKYPRKIKAGTVVSEPVTGVDFYPTLVALTGGIPDNGLDGEDIFDRMKKGTSKVQRALFWHFPAYLEGYQGLGRDFRATPYSIIRSGDWKLIYYYEDKSMELFNLKNDRMERNNLVNLQPTLAKELYTRLMKWLIDTRADIPTELNPAYIKAKKQ